MIVQASLERQMVQPTQRLSLNQSQSNQLHFPTTCKLFSDSSVVYLDRYYKSSINLRVKTIVETVQKLFKIKYLNPFQM